MGRVAGVLTSQGRGWGLIKRSLRRNGLPDVQSTTEKTRVEPEPEDEVIVIEVPENPIDFLQPLSQHQMEDAADLLSKTDGKGGDSTLQSLAGMIRDIERMIGTILNSHGGRWSEQEEELFLRIAIRRGWPVEDEMTSTRLLLVASRIAEAKGSRDVAFQEIGATPGSAPKTGTGDSDAIARIRAKMTEAEQIIAGLR